MDDAVTESLILDLLKCVASSERSYEEVMDAWRTRKVGRGSLSFNRSCAQL
jgi:hypothetical protein